MNYAIRIRGFTLIELIIILALISITAFLSVSFYSRYLLQNEVDNTVDRIVAALKKAQIYSMTGKANNGSWGVRYGSGNITLFQGDSFTSRNPALDENFALNNNISITGFTEQVFKYKTGTISSSLSFTISGNNNTKTVTLNPQGRISR